jgi:hypothetical protein
MTTTDRLWNWPVAMRKNRFCWCVISHLNKGEKTSAAALLQILQHAANCVSWSNLMGWSLFKFVFIRVTVFWGSLLCFVSCGWPLTNCIQFMAQSDSEVSHNAIHNVVLSKTVWNYMTLGSSLRRVWFPHLGLLGTVSILLSTLLSLSLLSSACM